MKKILLAGLMILSVASAAQPVDDKYSKSTHATVNAVAQDITGFKCSYLHSVKYKTSIAAKAELLATYRQAPYGYTYKEVPNGGIYIAEFIGDSPLKLKEYHISYFFRDKVNGGYYVTMCAVVHPVGKGVYS